MNFEQYLNEMPLLVKNNDWKGRWDSEYEMKLERQYNIHKVSKLHRNGKYQYGVFHEDGETIYIVYKEDDIICIAVGEELDLEDISGFSVNWLSKKPSIKDSDMVLNLYDYIIQKQGCLISDSMQSIGGKKVWEKLFFEYKSYGVTLGVYDKHTSTSNVYNHKDKFITWYNDVVEASYGNHKQLLYIEL